MEFKVSDRIEISYNIREKPAFNIEPNMRPGVVDQIELVKHQKSIYPATLSTQANVLLFLQIQSMERKSH